MSSKLHLKVITHEKVVFDRDVDEIYAAGEKGEFGILPNHIPFMTALRIGVTRAVIGTETIHIAIMGGAFQIKDNEAIILTSVAELADDIDVARAKEAKERAEARLGSAEVACDRRRAEVALAKALARLKASAQLGR